MPKQYTTRELATELDITVQRVEQLFTKHIRNAKLKLSEYVDYSSYPKKFTQKTLTLLKQKQKQNSKFNKFHK